MQLPTVIPSDTMKILVLQSCPKRYVCLLPNNKQTMLPNWGCVGYVCSKLQAFQGSQSNMSHVQSKNLGG